MTAQNLALISSQSTELALTGSIQFQFEEETLNKTSLAVNGDLVSGLLKRYENAEDTIINFSDFNKSIAFQYFCESVVSPYSKEKAVEKLAKDYWSSLMRETKIYDVLPAARRNEWLESLEDESNLPDFNKENVVNTLLTFLKEQGQYQAEKVHSAFKALSKSHITNQPQGFYKRCIFDVAHCDRNAREALHELRVVIAMLCDRYSHESHLIEQNTTALFWNTPRDGQWRSIDGDAMKIRFYKKGTVHLEFSEDVAWQLNEILSHVYGAAIPAEFKRKPMQRKSKRTQAKDISLIQKPLPFQVLDLIRDFKNTYDRTQPRQPRRIENAYSIQFESAEKADKHVLQQLDHAMQLIGAQKVNYGKSKIFNYYQFDFDADQVLHEIVISGVIPDRFSHQYYPTNDALAEKLVNSLNITVSDKVLEPSAGQGGIATHLPLAQSTLVEVSKLNCLVLSAKGFENVVNEDFLSYSKRSTKRFNVIVANPPFSENRAYSHIQASINLLADDGRLAAIVPASFNMELLDIPPGFETYESNPLHNEFVNTSVIVKIINIKSVLNK